MITVFGASGNTGSVVAGKLLDQGTKVRAVGRDASKLAALKARGAEIFVGEVTDAAAVAAALAGADGAYLLIPPAVTDNDVVGRARGIIRNYVAGLRANKVKHATLLSSVASQLPSGTGPIITTHHAEQELPASGAAMTFVRAAYFMENVLGFASAMREGTLPVFIGGEGYPFPMVATRDIGETAAAALLAPATSGTQLIELSGPREYSFNDVAAEAAKLLGKPVAIKVLPVEQIEPMMQSFGMSANMAGLYREMIEAFAAGRAGFEGKGKQVRGKVTVTELLRPALA